MRNDRNAAEATEGRGHRPGLTPWGLVMVLAALGVLGSASLARAHSEEPKGEPIVTEPTPIDTGTESVVAPGSTGPPTHSGDDRSTGPEPAAPTVPENRSGGGGPHPDGADPAAASEGLGGHGSDAAQPPWIGPLAVGALVAYLCLRERPLIRPFDGVLTATVVVLLVFAASVHIDEIGPHVEEGWALGAGFAVAAAAQLVQAAAIGLRASRRAYALTALANALLIGMYFAVREATLPLVGHRDPYLPAEYPVVAAEVVVVLTCATLMLRRPDLGSYAGAEPPLLGGVRAGIESAPAVNRVA